MIFITRYITLLQFVSECGVGSVVKRLEFDPADVGSNSGNGGKKFSPEQLVAHPGPVQLISDGISRII